MTNIDDRMERYIGGDMDETERIAFEREILANPDLSDRLYADANIGASIEAAVRARRERAWRAAAHKPRVGWPGLRWLVPAAAVIAVAVFMIAREPGVPERVPVFRGVTDGLTTIAPRGEVVEAPSTFIWRRSSSAEFYRFELFDVSASTPLFTTITADTSVTPESTEIPASGYWTVTPLNDLRMAAGDAVVTSYRVRQ